MKKITRLTSAIIFSAFVLTSKSQVFQNGQAASFAINALSPANSGTMGTTASNITSPVVQTCFAIDPKHNCVYVADYFGNRVLRFSYPITSNFPTANLVLGQANFTSGGYNGVTANTMYNPQGLAVDTASGTLYVLAIGQSRVLRFDNAHTITTNGVAANAVFGKTSFTSTANGTTQNLMSMNQGPACGNLIHYDQLTGALWVSDNNNSRVLRFDNANAAASGANANAVLGQTSFTTNSTGLSDTKFSRPDGLTTIGSSLFLADPTYNRVLRFDNVYSKADGAAADAVIGQTNFTSGGGGISATKLNSPTDVTADQNNLFISDVGNSRILIISNATTNTTGNNVLLSSNLTTAGSGAASATTGGSNFDIEFDGYSNQLFVQDRNNARILVFQGCPPVQITGVSAICAGQSATLSTTGATTFTWNTNENTASIVVTPTSSTTYSILGRYAGSTYTCFTNATKSITVNSAPVISVNSGSICAGESFTLNASGASTYTYSGGQVVNPATTTTYSVSGTSAAGCISSAAAISAVTVNALPVISVSNAAICEGASYTIVPTGASTYTIQGGNSVVSPSSSSSYTITGSSAAGCISANAATCNVTVNLKPTIAVSNATICAGASHTFVPSGAATYTIQGGSLVVSPASSSNYSITGTSAQGCTSNNTVTASLLVNPTPVIAVNNGTICSGNSFTITPSGASTYTIQGGNSVVSPISSTSYSVSGTNSFGCTSANAAISSVVVNVSPTVSVNSGSICSGDNFTLVPAGAANYAIQGNNLVVNPSSTTSYTVSGISTEGCLSVNTATALVTVNLTPIVSVNNGTICSGNSFLIVASGAASYAIEGGNTLVSPTVSTNYTVTGTSTEGCVSANTATCFLTVNITPTVSVNSGSICNGQSFTIVPAGATNYTVQNGNTVVAPTSSSSYTVVGESVDGCVSANTATSSVVVYANPVITCNNGAICIGQSYTLSPSGANSYSYSNGPVVTPGSTSSYSITGTSSEGCISTQIVATVTVNALPVVSVSASVNQTCVNDATISVNASPVGGTFAGNSVVNGVFTPTLSGNYQLVYSFTQPGTGCSSSDTTSLKVEDCTGIEKLTSTQEISVYPNPTKSSVTINYSNGSVTKIIVSDLSGRVLLVDNCSGNQHTIDLSNVSNGIYMIQLTSDRHISTAKVVKY